MGDTQASTQEATSSGDKMWTETEDEKQLFELGKKHLSLAKSEDDDEGKTIGKAVAYLIKASQKGNDDATGLLKECVKQKRGITKGNKDDVKWCIETSPFEKRVREASKGLFHILGGEKNAMPYDEYKGAVKAQEFKDKKIERLLIAAGKEVGTEITESKLSKVLSEQIQGTINLTASEREEQSQEFKSADMLTRILKYPKPTAKLFFDEGIETISKEGVSWVTSSIPTNQLYLLSAFFLYSLISASLLIMVVPILVFYVTFVIMCVVTLQAVVKRQKLKESAKLAEVLGTFSNIDARESTSRFARNSLSPYWMFLSVLPFFVVSFALSRKTYIPSSEMFTFSSVIAVITFFALTENYFDPARWLAILLNFIAALPTLLQNFPQNLSILSKIVNILTTAFVRINLGNDLKINIGVPSIAYVLLCIVFIVMAARDRWSGTYRVLLPFFVTQFWLNVATSMFPYSNWFGLLRSSLGSLFLPVLLPMSILIGVVYGFFAVINSFQSGLLIKVFITLAIGAVPLVLSQTDTLFGVISNSKVKNGAMILFSVLAFIPLTMLDFSGGSPSQTETFELLWNKYNSLCLSGDTNRIKQQLGCRYFIGQEVVWNGTFQNASVTEVSNSLEPLLSGLPTFLTQKVRCTYGLPYGDCKSNTSKLEEAVCTSSKVKGIQCHLQNYDTYSFQVSVSMPDFNGALLVDAGNSFKDVLLALQKDDAIEITATLGDGQGTLSPKLKLRNIRCVKCRGDVTQYINISEDDEEDFIYKSINEGIGVVVRFFWYPILEYSK